MDTMDSIEKEISKIVREPSQTDIERYSYYIKEGINKEMIALLPEKQFDVFFSYLSLKLKSQPSAKRILNELKDDVSNDYEFSMRKAIIDYILLNYEERQRLKIEYVPRPFALK